MTTDEKRAAMERVIAEARQEAAAVQMRYPGWIGVTMACRIIVCASAQLRYIATYTPSDGTGVVIGPNLISNKG